MSKYRIKIEEKYNGEKQYTPQICKLEITRGWFQKQRLVWYNIINNHGDNYILSLDKQERYSNEIGAMEVIRNHRDYVNKEQGKLIKSTVYKTIE